MDEGGLSVVGRPYITTEVNHPHDRLVGDEATPVGRVRNLRSSFARFGADPSEARYAERA